MVTVCKFISADAKPDSSKFRTVYTLDILFHNPPPSPSLGPFRGRGAESSHHLPSGQKMLPGKSIMRVHTGGGERGREEREGRDKQTGET